MKVQYNEIEASPSLSESTPIILNFELTHLGSLEASESLFSVVRGKSEVIKRYASLLI